MRLSVPGVFGLRTSGFGLRLSGLLLLLCIIGPPAFHTSAAPPPPPGLLQHHFLTVTSNLLATNTFTFRTGTGGLEGRAGYLPGSSYQHEYLRDFLFAVQAVPGFFTARDLRLRIEWYASHTRTNAITDSIGFSPRSGASCDAQYDFVDLIYQHYRLSSSSKCFTEFQPAISNALNTVPVRDHLVWLTNGLIGWGFNDMMKKNGYECMSSLLRYRACRQLGEMAAAAGQAESSAAWFAEMPRLQAALREKLWDGLTGLYFDNSGTNLHNIPANAYAVLIGACDEATALTISRKLVAGLPGGLDAMAGRGFTDNGAIRMFPLNEVPSGSYQWGGYWPAFTGWVAAAVDLTDGEKSQQLVSSLVASFGAPGKKLCTFEWFNSSKGTGADNYYLASAAGPALFTPRAAGSRALPDSCWGSLSNVVLTGDSINATPFSTQSVAPVLLFTCYTNLNRRAVATVRFAFDASQATRNATGDFSFAVHTFRPGSNLTNVWTHEWTSHDPRQKLSTPLTFWLSPGEVYFFHLPARMRGWPRLQPVPPNAGLSMTQP